MQKYRIVLAAIMATGCATVEVQSQMSMLFNRASEPVVFQGSTQPNSSCSMPSCRPVRPYGHFGTSWRRWPEDVSTYTTNPRLTPFVVPDRSGAPDTVVPDALDEAEFTPKYRSRGKKQQDNNDPPSTLPDVVPDIDDGTSEDLPSAEPSGELPDVSNDDFPTIDLEESPAPSFETDGFADPEPSVSPDTDDGFLEPFDDVEEDGLDEFDAEFGSDGLGSDEPRRFHRRNNRSITPPFEPRSIREATLPIDGPLVRATGAEIRPATVEGSNPLRPTHLSQQHDSVDYAYDGQIDYRDSRRRENRRHYLDDQLRRPQRRDFGEDRRQRQYDVRQIGHHEEPGRYRNRRSRHDEPRGGYYLDDQYMPRERRTYSYDPPMQRATDFPEKSSNPLRP